MTNLDYLEQINHLNAAYVQAFFEIFNPLSRLERLVSEEDEI